MFQHVLITRFNLRLEEWNTTKHGDAILSEKWLAHRFELFETYCLPSVKQQTNQNFIWLVCFDTQTPLAFQQRISELSIAYPNFKPIYINGNLHFHEAIKKSINSFLKENNTHIITTRLDNDDAIHKDFISSIQKAFQPKDGLVIDLVKGFQLIKKKSPKDDAIRQMNSEFNPFVSVIENKANYKTVLSRTHQLWETQPHIKLSNKRLWMQVIHEQNISNSEKLYYHETNKIKISDFGITYKIELKSNLKIGLHTIWSYIQRLLIKLKL